MVVTDDVQIPTPKEINHRSIPLTHNFFLSSAMWLGKYCDNQCKEFMLCRAEEKDPRKCLNEGRDVTDCGFDFFRKVKATCKEELEWYTKCLDFSGYQPEFRRCRQEQAMFDQCMYSNGFERAKFGDFQLLRVHETKRPRVKPNVPLFPDSVEDWDYYDPENIKRVPGGHRNTHMWQTWN